MTLQILERLGGGGFGIVELVQAPDGSRYARKTFSVAATMPPIMVENVRRRFVREAKTQSGIRHRNIVPVLDAELSADPPNYLMPVAVCSLQDDLDRDRHLGGNWLTAIADIVAGLDELHQMGIYHRDLKPQNVLRYADPVDPSAPHFYALSDFGLIAMNESRVSLLTTTGMAKGTDYYTAPEVTSDLRLASPQSDIYSLGCILHEMVGTAARVPCHEIKETGEFAAVLRNCTRQDPSRRFPSVRSVLDTLVALNTTVAPVSNGSPAVGFLQAFNAGHPLSGDQWKALVHFVEDNEDENDTRVVLNSLTLEQISALAQKDAALLDRLGVVYSEWVRGKGFPFERCDNIANILEVFTLSTSYETRVDALVAMLELGVSHNRWYVERKFWSSCGPTLEEGFARRLGVEFRAAGQQICRSIEHVERSIGVNRRGLHPALQQVLADICP